MASGRVPNTNNTFFMGIAFLFFLVNNPYESEPFIKISQCVYYYFFSWEFQDFSKNNPLNDLLVLIDLLIAIFFIFPASQDEIQVRLERDLLLFFCLNFSLEALYFYLSIALCGLFFVESRKRGYWIRNIPKVKGYGSGPIEKTVDITVSRRFKKRGMSWFRHGVNPLLQMRLLKLNEEWELYWDQRKTEAAKYAA